MSSKLFLLNGIKKNFGCCKTAKSGFTKTALKFSLNGFSQFSKPTAKGRIQKDKVNKNSVRGNSSHLLLRALKHFEREKRINDLLLSRLFKKKARKFLLRSLALELQDLASKMPLGLVRDAEEIRQP